MTRVTRSGRLLQHGGGSSTKSASKGKNVKANDATPARRSTRRTPSKTTSEVKPSPKKPDKVVKEAAQEKPSKKLREPRLDRLEKEVSSKSSDKKNPGSVNNKRPHSPSRRSERLGNHGIPNSSSKKRKTSPEKNNEGGSGKTGVSMERTKSKTPHIERGGPSRRKKPLTTFRYITLLMPSNGNLKCNDDNTVNIRDDTASRPNSHDIVPVQPTGSKTEHGNGDMCNDRKEDEIMLKHCENGSKEDLELSSYGSGDHVDMTEGKNDGRKLEARPSLSNCIHTSSRSSGEGKEISEDGKLCSERLGQINSGVPELIASTSQGKYTLGDISPELGSGGFGGSRTEKMDSVQDSHILLTPTNAEFTNPDSSLVDPTSSLPIPFQGENMKQCIVCCKNQRDCDGSQAKNFCSCNLPRENCMVTSDDKNGSVPFRAVEDGERLSVIDEVCIDDRPILVQPKHTSLPVQTNCGTNACMICKSPGRLLCCAGKDCRKGYHLSCLKPPLQGAPFGLWLCHSCVKKKLELGVHSVSDGIESIWDVKEGMQNVKLYFVKYKGLAHVHNLWVPEIQLLNEVPDLFAKFNMEYQKVTRWKQEWTEPHRLLQKRLVMPKYQLDEYIAPLGDKISSCSYEWFVKWKSLGYESASWELENSPFLCSPEAKMLIKDYEHRCNEAKRNSDLLRADEALQIKREPFHKLTTLPNEYPAILDNDHITSINRLREFWHKSQNAVFIDDQERIMKSILFIGSLLSHACRPFLVISTIASLSFWESEFIRLAPSVNVVVYNGDTKTRRLIRTVEFYENGACPMFQVLVSHPDAITEDFEAVNCISWEAVIVDVCQSSTVSGHLEQLKCLSTEFRLLLVSSQLKDNVADCINLLSFLNSGIKDNGTSSLNINPGDTRSLAVFKERWARHLAYERRLESGKFVEYWVPVRLSNVQLEQYCATLVSNSVSLRSCSKNDQIGALREILISIRKCCDHPYLVDDQLPGSLTKGLPTNRFLDIGVKASGKLLLLDKILQEIKEKGLRVLIIFQSVGGAGRNPIGDILDDYIRQRFGTDSFERIDSGLVMAKKQVALNMFNDKKRGRFVFLIENRACLPSVKLSSVDVVVIFDSDWNPLNDLRALQKMTIESQFAHIEVLRLYASFTVEEKVLMLAKQDTVLESNIQHISPTNSHTLLSWGAPYLFTKLDEFHQDDSTSNSETTNDNLILNEAIVDFVNTIKSEVLTQLPGGSYTDKCSILVKATQSGASYSRSICLLGEKEGITSLDKDTSTFWSNLLVSRDPHPKWRFVSDHSQRSRKRPSHLINEPTKNAQMEHDEVRRKHRKLSVGTVDRISLQNWLQDKTKGSSNGKNPVANDALQSHVTNRVSNPLKEAEAHDSPDNTESECMTNPVDLFNDSSHNQQITSKFDECSEVISSRSVESGRKEKLRDIQRSLHLALKPELDELSDFLKLPEEVKSEAQLLLEYVMNNHQVGRNKKALLQALKISLCRKAAASLNHQFDHKECLARAKKYLNFVCDEKQADSVYTKIYMLKISQRFGNKSNLSSVHCYLSSPREVDIGHHLRRESPKSAQLNHLDVGESEKIHDGPSSAENVVLEDKQTAVCESPPNFQQNIESSNDECMRTKLDLIQVICSSRAKDFLVKQQRELSDFNVDREDGKMKLKTAHDSDLVLVRSVHTDYTTRHDKIKLLNKKFSNKMEEYDNHMKSQRIKLVTMQEVARNKENEIRDLWLKEAESGTLPEGFDKLPLTDSCFRLEDCEIPTGQFESCNGTENMMESTLASDQVCSDTIETCYGEPNELVVEHLEVQSVLPSISMKGDHIETEIAAPVTKTPERFSSAGPSEAFVSDSAVDQIYDSIATEGSGEYNVPSANLSKVPSDIPGGSGQDLPLESGAVSQSSTRVEVESVEPTLTSGLVSKSVLPHATGIMPSQTNTVNAEGSDIDAVLIDWTVEAPVITARGLEEGRENFDHRCEQIQAEIQSEQADVVSTESNQRLIGSVATTSKISEPSLLDGDRHPNHDMSRLNYLLQENPVESVPSSSVVETSRYEIIATSNPIPSIGELERPLVSVTAQPDKHTAIPDPVDVVPLQVEQIISAQLTENPAPTGSQVDKISPAQQLTAIPGDVVPSQGDQTIHEICTVNRISSEMPSSVDASFAENGATLSEAEQVHNIGALNSPSSEVPASVHISTTENNPAVASLVEQLGNTSTLVLTTHVPASVHISTSVNGTVVPADVEQTVDNMSNSIKNGQAVPSEVPRVVASQVEKPVDNTSFSHSIPSEVPTSAEIASTVNEQGINTAQLEAEPCAHPTNVSVLEAEVPLRNPTSDTALHADQTNPSVTLSGVPPLPLHSSVPQLPVNSNVQLAGTRPRHLEIARGCQSELGGPSPFMPPWTAAQVISPDPIENELHRVKKQLELRSKIRDEQKVQLKLDLDQQRAKILEMLAKLTKNYELQFNNVEATYAQDEKYLGGIYNKLYLNKHMAEEFRAKFIENKGAVPTSSGTRQNAMGQNYIQTSQAQRAFLRQPAPPQRQAQHRQVAAPIHPPIIASNSPLIQAQMRTPLVRPAAITRPMGPPAPMGPPMAVRTAPPSFPTNQARTQFSPSLAPRGNSQGTETRARAPAPHLFRFRPPVPMPSAVIIPAVTEGGPTDLRSEADLSGADASAARERLVCISDEE